MVTTEQFFDLIMLQRLGGGMETLKYDIPAADALAQLERASAQDFGPGTTVFLRPSAYSLPPTPTPLEQLLAVAHAAGAEGIWFLHRAEPFISYQTPLSEEDADARTAFVGLCEYEACMGDDGEQRGLDLGVLSRVLIINLGHGDTDAPIGLTTLVPQEGWCRACGCSDLNSCETEDGLPCRWVEPDLCSACAARQAKDESAKEDLER